MTIKSTTHRIFCTNMRMIRNAKGLTQQELADNMGMSVTQVNGLELAVREPLITTVERVALGLGVTVSDMFDPELAKRQSHQLVG